MTTPSQLTPADPAAVEAFAEHLMGVMDAASLALMLSVGHQVGLFDAMAAMAEPATSAEIADAASLDERYVREWLGAVSTAGVVEYDATDRRYRLPADRAALLTTAAGPDNLARMMQYVPLLASVEQQVIDSFRRGGGVPYEQYPRFHEVMAEDSAAVYDAALVDTILPIADGVVERLQEGIDVLDVGCGSGHAVAVMAAAFPRSRFTGLDFSVEAIDRARAEASARGLSNAGFAVQDVADMKAVAAYDLITAFDAIHDQARPAQVLARIARALRAGGTFLMVDISASSNLEDNIGQPLATWAYTVSTMHCMTVSLALGGAGLGTAWGRQLAQSMLREAGFRSIDVRESEVDPFNDYYVARLT